MTALHAPIFQAVLAFPHNEKTHHTILQDAIMISHIYGKSALFSVEDIQIGFIVDQTFGLLLSDIKVYLGCSTFNTDFGELNFQHFCSLVCLYSNDILQFVEM